MMNDIIKKIDQKIEEIGSNAEVLSDKWKYIADLYDKMASLSRVEVDISDFFVAYIGINNNKIDFDFLKQFVSDNRVFFSQANDVELTSIADAIKDYLNQFDDDQLDDVKITKKENKRLLKGFNCDFSQLLELFKNQEEQEVYDAFIIAGEIIRLREEVHTIRDFADEEFDEEEYERMKKSAKPGDAINEISFEMAKRIYDKDIKNRRNFANKEIKKMIKNSNLPAFLNDIVYAINEEEKRIKNQNRNIQKRIDNYKKINKSLIKEKDDKQITGISYIANHIDDKELLKDILIEIYNHNIAEQIRMEDKYNKLSCDHKNQLKFVFDKYGINCDINSINNSIENDELEYELENLRVIGFKDNDLILDIINVTDQEQFKNVVALISEGYITREFVMKNANIFNKNVKESVYPIIIKNIKVIKDIGINPEVLSFDCGILLTNNERFNKNIEILNDYKLIRYFRDSTSYDFLKSVDLDQRIDIILELGLENFLKENLAILDYNVGDYKKVLINKKIGQTPNKLGDLLYMLTDDMIKEEIIDEYFYNYNEEVEKDTTMIDISDLSSFDKSSRLLKINDVLISKYKVYSQAKDGKVRFCDIVKNSILSEEEYETVKNSVLGRTI